MYSVITNNIENKMYISNGYSGICLDLKEIPTDVLKAISEDIDNYIKKYKERGKYAVE